MDLTGNMWGIREVYQSRPHLSSFFSSIFVVCFEMKSTSSMSTKKTPTNPEGGWLPPKTKDFHAFWTRVQKEAVQLFGTDEDGSPCIVVDMTDRSRYESIKILPVPRSIEESPYHPYGKRKWSQLRRDLKTNKVIRPAHTPQEEEVRRSTLLENKRERMRMIDGNVDIAMTRARQFHYDLQSEIEDQINAPERQRNARIKELQLKKAFHADPVQNLLDRGYVVDVDTQTYWYAKDDGLDAPESRVKKIPTLPADFADLMKELDELLAYKLPKPKEL